MRTNTGTFCNKCDTEISQTESYSFNSIIQSANTPTNRRRFIASPSSCSRRVRAKSAAEQDPAISAVLENYDLLHEILSKLAQGDGCSLATRGALSRVNKLWQSVAKTLPVGLDLSAPLTDIQVITPPLPSYLSPMEYEVLKFSMYDVLSPFIHTQSTRPPILAPSFRIVGNPWRVRQQMIFTTTLLVCNAVCSTSF